MKIVAPISTIEEIPLMASEGAQEQYFTFRPDKRPVNRATPTEQRHRRDCIRQYAELEEAVRITHDNSCSLSMLLAMQRYSDGEIDEAVETAEAFVEMGGDSLIVSGLSLINELSSRIPLGLIHFSCTARSLNSSAPELCRDLGVSRLILAPGATITEACEISRKAPDLEIEMPMFRPRILYGYRANEYKVPFGHSVLCSLATMLQGEIAAVNIACGDASIADKLMIVQAIRTALDLLETGGHADEIMVTPVARPSVNHANNGHMCS